MMAPNSRIIMEIAVVLSVISKGSCIHCYYCNSANNSACMDVNKYEEEIRSRVVPIVNCETAVGPARYNFFCRKIVQTIFHSHRETEVRVTRGCGWIHDKDKPCYRNDNRDHYETVCQCFSDHCNAADNPSPTGVTLFLVISATLYFCR